MRPILFLLLLLMVLGGVNPPRLEAQSTLRGTVRTASGAAVPGALVVILPGSHSTTTNMLGKYQFRALPAGTLILAVQSVGYATRMDTVRIAENAITEWDVRLDELMYTLGTFDVAAGRDGARTAEEARMRTLRPEDVVARAGAAEDVLRNLQSLPGITSPSDFSSQLVVRGSGPDHTQIVFDGVEVFHPYRLYGGMSMFHPSLIREARFHAGGFPASYGDRLAAVLDVSSRDGQRLRPLGGEADVTLINGSILAEGPVALRGTPEEDGKDEYSEDASLPWNGSWMAAIRRTYYDLLAGPLVRDLGLMQGTAALPNFTDFQFRLTLQMDYRNGLAFTGLTNRDQANFLARKDFSVVGKLDVDDVTFNDLAAVTWTHVFSNQTIGKTILSYYQLGGSNSFSSVMAPKQSLGLDLSTEEYEEIKDSLRRAGLNAEDLMSALGNYRFLFRKTSLRHTLLFSLGERHRVETGLTADWLDSDMRLGVTLDPRVLPVRQSNPKLSALPESFDSHARGLRASAYAQDALRLSETVTVLPGLRADWYGLLDKGVLSPRLSATWSPFPLLTFSGAWGLYHQSPGYEKQFMPGYEVYLNRTIFDLSGDWARSLVTEKARHLVLGAEWMHRSFFSVRVEAYDKTMWDLVIARMVTGSRYTTDRIPGTDIHQPEGWTAPYAIPTDSLTNIPYNGGEGRARGLELTLRKDFASPDDPLAWSLSWTWSLSERTQHGYTFPYDYDRRHSVTASLTWRFARDWDLAVAGTWGTGFPNNVPVSVQPRVYLKKDSVTGISRPTLDVDYRGVVFEHYRGGLANLNSSRLPDYFRLDLRLTTRTSWFGWTWELYLDVINVTNRTNIIIYEYYVDRETLELRSSPLSMLPILPSLGLHVRF